MINLENELCQKTNLADFMDLNDEIGDINLSFMKKSDIKRIQDLLKNINAKYKISSWITRTNPDANIFSRNFYKMKYSIIMPQTFSINKTKIIFDINYDSDEYFYVVNKLPVLPVYYKIDSIEGLINFLDGAFYNAFYRLLRR